MSTRPSLTPVHYLKIFDAALVASYLKVACDNSHAVIHEDKSVLMIRADRLAHFRIDVSWAFTLSVSDVIIENTFDYFPIFILDNLDERRRIYKSKVSFFDSLYFGDGRPIRKQELAMN